MEFLDLLFSPFAFVLRYLTQWLDNYGLALIVFCVVIAIFRLPFDFKGRRGNLKQAILQPKVKEIQEKHAGNQQKIQQEIHKLWQQEGVKPLGGCVWMLLPAAIMLIMINIVREPLRHLMGLSRDQLHSLREAMLELGISVPDDVTGFAQVEMAGYIRPYYNELRALVPDIFRETEIFPMNMEFLTLNLGLVPQWQIWNFFGQPDFAMHLALFFLPLFSMGMMFISQKIMMATNYMQQAGGAQQQQMMKMMMMTFPLFSIFIGFSFPAAMSVYFISSSFFFTIASIFINRKVKKIYEQLKAEMEERDRLREAELEAKRQETARLRALNATRENKATSKKKKQLQERERQRQRQAAARGHQEGEEETEPEIEENLSRVAHRKFARGRAYDPDRFDGLEEDTDDLEEELPVDEETELEPTDQADGPEEDWEEQEATIGESEEEPWEEKDSWDDEEEDAWDAEDGWDDEEEADK